MYHRAISPEILQLAGQYPVVTITGPRQSGKTTLVRHLFPTKPYFNLEAPDIREKISADPRAFFESLPEGAILDEIQRLPILLSYIQVIADEAKRTGMFILTGSHQIELHQAIAQSLAGRTALLRLLPLSLAELAEAGIVLSLDEALYRGGFPRVFIQDLNPTKAYRQYVETYVERDLRQLIQVKDLSQFQRFLRLLAGRIGQLMNAEGLAGELGTSSHTVREWISILEASYLVIRLQPYFENFGKRIVKSSKVYFADMGLACYLLGIESLEQLSRDPLRGQLTENLALLEFVKARHAQALDPQLYFFRDAHGHEVDFIFQRGRTLIPIEVKSAKTFHAEYLKGIRFFQELAGDRAPQGYLIYGGSQEERLGSSTLLPFEKAHRVVTAS